MNVEMMKAKLDACFKRLQTLDIQPTKDNMEALLQTLYDMQEVYKELGGELNEPDPEGRNSD